MASNTQSHDNSIDLHQALTLHSRNFSKKFNYIHSEAMIGAIQDWPKLFSQSFE